MIGRPIIRLDEIGSTQDLAFRLGELGAPEGTVVVARYQRAGRGRSGRTWEAPPGAALLFSALLRPSGVLPGAFSLLVADAIAETLAVCYALQPKIKWPNDVLVEGRKLSGVLIQIRGGIAALGIGLNVRARPDELPDGATSLLAETGREIAPQDVLNGLLPTIEDGYRRAMSGDIGSTIARIEERLFLRGEAVTLRDGERMLEGRVLGLRADGALLLETGGVARGIVSGELVRGPRPLVPEALPGSRKPGILKATRHIAPEGPTESGT